MRITSEVFKLFLDEGKKDNKHFLEFFRIWKTSIKLIFRGKKNEIQDDIFDLDGTITDSAPGIMNSIKYALEKNHLPMLSEEQLRSFIGPPLRGQFCKVCGLADEESARMVEDYREYYRDKGIFGNNVYDGVIEMLEN